MKIEQYDIWLANLNPAKGTEPGKVRPVVIIQTDLLNNTHPSTLICPITTNVLENVDILRIHLKKGQTDVKSDVLVDQIRAIDNKRLIEKLGKLDTNEIKKIQQNLKVILDLE